MTTQTPPPVRAIPRRATAPPPPPPPQSERPSGPIPQLIVHKPGEKMGKQSLVIYGPSGVGKTTLITSFPGKGVLIDIPQAEGGDWVIPDKSGRIMVRTIEKWDEIEEIYQFIAFGQHDYQWVCIDSLSAMQMLARRKEIGERDLIANPHKTTQPEYGTINERDKELVYKFKKLPNVHTLWTAQERKFRQDEDGFSNKIGPALYPGFVDSLLPPMLLVGRLSIVGGKRRLRLHTHPDYFCKVRSLPNAPVPDVIKIPELEFNEDGTAKNHDTLARLVRYLLHGGVPPEPIDEDDDGFIVVE